MKLGKFASSLATTTLETFAKDTNFFPLLLNIVSIEINKYYLGSFNTNYIIL